MKSLMLCIGLVGSISVVGCSDQTSPTAPASELAVAGSSGCSTVNFTTALIPAGPTEYTGTVSGDLQGTVEMVFDEFHPMTGVTRVVAADATWHITGGIVPELIGETFVTRLTNRNVFLPNTSLVKNIGSLRAISGVERANLTYVGQTSLLTELPNLEFVGVICP